MHNRDLYCDEIATRLSLNIVCIITAFAFNSFPHVKRELYIILLLLLSYLHHSNGKRDVTVIKIVSSFNNCISYNETEMRIF